MLENNALVIRDIANSLDTQRIEQAQSIEATNDIDAIQVWLREFIKSENTFISYRQTAERFIMWLYQQHLKLKDVTREVIQNYEEFLTQPVPTDFWCGASRPRGHAEWKPFVKGLSNSSIRLNLQILGSMFQYLIEAGYLVRNPFRLIRQKAKKATASVERFLNSREWQCVLDYIENLPQTTPKEIFEYERTLWIFNLLYLTGCRRSEIVNATMADFMNNRSQWWFKVIGKGDKYGEIPVPNQLLSALIRFRRVVGLTDYPNATEINIPIIFNKYGVLKPISDSMLYKIVRTTCKKIADELKFTDPASSFVIERVSTHWMRHTSATHQVDAGIDIRVVKENLRHSMLETTIKYQHTESDTRYDETVNKFGTKEE